MGGIAAATFLSIILAMPWFLLALGFGALGPVAGGLAAALQPFCGLSYVFGCLQSSAMTLANGFLNCGMGQAIYAFGFWMLSIPMASLAAGGTAYAGYVYLPQCNETVNFTNVTNVH
ncbi:hypothetical protein FOCC_FOCC004838 [Frankliniella occidentalis]|uniref:Uncharacterized protein LOC113202376 isoform X2 n=1 Tax=Frankliniella occidentalis TaxID=133901 RepID=A0A6J1S0L7_FRAOC|nr:uncharacterized protein LOC113202376 isoform X2 [Frankliniella occidentalis]KAE8748406.1 hypothetical protein FOCC_FOCC004838 [Frankliniella occidentalis]